MRCIIIPCLETKLCGRELSSWQKCEEAAAGLEELRWQIQSSLLPAASPASCSQNRVCKGGGKSYNLITRVPCLHLHTPSTEKQPGDRLALGSAGGQAGDTASGCWRSSVGRGVPHCSGAPYPITASLLHLYPPASCWLRAGTATEGHAKGQKCEAAASEKPISCSLSRGGLRADSTTPPKKGQADPKTDPQSLFPRWTHRANQCVADRCFNYCMEEDFYMTRDKSVLPATAVQSIFPHWSSLCFWSVCQSPPLLFMTLKSVSVRK